MGLGNDNPNKGNKGSNFSYQLGVLKVLNKILVAVGGSDGSTRTLNTVSTSAVGKVPAGTYRGSVLNVGVNSGTFNGTALLPGVGLSWDEVKSDLYEEIDYDPTASGGTTFIIEYTT